MLSVWWERFCRRTNVVTVLNSDSGRLIISHQVKPEGSLQIIAVKYFRAIFIFL